METGGYRVFKREVVDVAHERSYAPVVRTPSTTVAPEAGAGVSTHHLAPLAVELPVYAVVFELRDRGVAEIRRSQRHHPGGLAGSAMPSLGAPWLRPAALVR